LIHFYKRADDGEYGEVARLPVGGDPQ